MNFKKAKIEYTSNKTMQPTKATLMPDHAGPVIEELLPELQDNPVSSGQIALQMGDRDAEEVVVESSEDSTESIPCSPQLFDASLFWMTFNMALHEEEQDYLMHKVLSMIHIEGMQYY